MTRWLATGSSRYRRTVTSQSSTSRTVVLDVDGTLLDSNYHHVVAWARAFEGVGVTAPLWRIHRHIGMGGDRLVPAVAGDEVEEQHGDRLRELWKSEYDELIDETQLFAGARELLVELRRRGHTVALASSSIPEHARRPFDLLDAEKNTDTATTAEDAEESKPDPELLEEALRRVGDQNPVMIGDSVWDIEAARKAGIPAYALLAGGYGREELEDAGAEKVYTDLGELLADVDSWAP